MAHSLHSGWVSNMLSVPTLEQVYCLFTADRRPWTHKGRTYMIPRWEYIGYSRDDKAGYINLDARPADTIYKTPKELGLSFWTGPMYADSVARLDRHIKNRAKFGLTLLTDEQHAAYIAHETKRQNDEAAIINNALHAVEMKTWERRRAALGAWAAQNRA